MPGPNDGITERAFRVRAGEERLSDETKLDGIVNVVAGLVRFEAVGEFVGAVTIIALNRAVAIAQLDGPDVALAVVDQLEEELADYHAYHATRADLLRRLNRNRQSRAAYDRAIELAGNTAEIAHLARRRDQLAP